MAMEMRARCDVAALPPMEEAALGGPESVEQHRALLHVVAQAEQIGDEVPRGCPLQVPALRLRRFTFYLRVPPCQSSTPERRPALVPRLEAFKSRSELLEQNA